MAKSVKVKKSVAVALFLGLGYEAADTWTIARLIQKFKKLPEMLEDDTSCDTDDADAKKLLKAIKKDGAIVEDIEVIDDGKKGKKKGGKAENTKGKKKGKKSKASDDDDDEDEEDEEEEDEDEEDEDEESDDDDEDSDEDEDDDDSDDDSDDEDEDEDDSDDEDEDSDEDEDDDDESDDEEDEDVDDEDEDDKKSKKKKKGKKSKKGSSGSKEVKRDKLGAKIGSKGAAINAVLLANKKPLSASTIAKKAKVGMPRTQSHLANLREAKKVKKTEDGYKLAK